MVAAFLLLVLALIGAGFALRGGGGGAPSVDGFAELPLTDDRTPYLQGAPGRDLARLRAISERGCTNTAGWTGTPASCICPSSGPWTCTCAGTATGRRTMNNRFAPLPLLGLLLLPLCLLAAGARRTPARPAP
ncbi:hypothetical protein HML84_04110 [Alcanivorax sp. IO_7]|nr:hypothetical protein HML84_04110 [Alcanivorax sp. IO_7]